MKKLKAVIRSFGNLKWENLYRAANLLDEKSGRSALQLGHASADAP
jgi:hypothetical protein